MWREVEAIMALTTQVTKIFQKGLIADAVQSLGVSTIVNVVDKKLGGKAAAAGVNIPFATTFFNNKPLSLNVTDIIVLMAVVGSPSNWLKKKNLVSAGVAFGVKKFAEAFDYIDPDIEGIPANKTNITVARENRQAAYVSMGGLTHS